MSAAAPILSVIVPSHDHGAYLDAAMRSVCAQTVGPLEVIVVDDGSTDDTSSRLRSWRARGVRVVSQARRGPSAARNSGVALASSEFVAFLDADDLWPAPDVLEAALAALGRYPEAGWVFADAQPFVLRDSAPVLVDRPYLEAAGYYTSGTPAVPPRLMTPAELCNSERFFIPTGTVVVRKQCLDQVGGFDEQLQMFEDTDMWLRLLRYPVVFLPRVSLWRRVHDSNVSHGRWAHLDDMRTLFERHGLAAHGVSFAFHAARAHFGAGRDAWRRRDFEAASAEFGRSLGYRRAWKPMLMRAVALAAARLVAPPAAASLRRGGLRCEIVDSLAGMRKHLEEWEALYCAVPAASVFKSPAMVLNWIESFAHEAPIHCTFVRDERSLLAAFPMVTVETRWRRVPLRALTACTNAHAVRCAVLVDGPFAAAAWVAWGEALRRSSGWDMVLLDGCEADGVASAPLPGAGRMRVDRWAHSCLPIRGTWSDFLASCSRDLRRNLRRAQMDLEAMGRLRFEEIEQDADGLFEQWAEVDRASWKAGRGETVDSDERTAGFYRRMVRLLAARGKLLGGVLSLDDAPIAVVVCARDKGVVHTLKTSMREDLSDSRRSPGTLAMARMLEVVWRQPGASMVDFVSRRPYTERWSRDTLAFERRIAFAATWRGRVASMLDGTARSASGVLRADAKTLHT